MEPIQPLLETTRRGDHEAEEEEEERRVSGSPVRGATLRQGGSEATTVGPRNEILPRETVLLGQGSGPEHHSLRIEGRLVADGREGRGVPEDDVARHAETTIEPEEATDWTGFGVYGAAVGDFSELPRVGDFEDEEDDDGEDVKEGDG